jgi:hypothetical protein
MDEKAGRAFTRPTGTPSASTVTDPVEDVHAWTGVFLGDGRVVSIAWLRGYPGAVASRWRRWRG